ncbi:hypothetical protein KCU81_g830, partial [Aureobasidium melanogenum]
MSNLRLLRPQCVVPDRQSSICTHKYCLTVRVFLLLTHRPQHFDRDSISHSKLAQSLDQRRGLLVAAFFLKEPIF